MKEKRDIIRPIILKVGVALALSFAGFLFSRLKNKRPKFPPHPSDHVGKADVEGRTETEKTPISGSEDSISVDKHEDTFRPRVAVDNPVMIVSPNSRNGGDKDGYLLPEFCDVVKEFVTSPTNDALVSLKKELETPRSDFETLQASKCKEKEEYEQEIRYLRAVIGNLQEREKNLEFQLLEFYGLKEQETALIELQKRLELSNMEAKLFTLKIESLQAENQILKEEVATQAKIASELDAARGKIKFLKKMLRSEAEQNKQQILNLRERVVKLQEQEAAGIGSDIQLTLEKLRILESEIEDLRKSNFKLQQENSELAHECESTQVLANSVLEDLEAEALQKLTCQLRQENEELQKKVEQLHADRCTDVEELVYLRWINACLRYELRNLKPEHDKTVARDLSRSLSPESEAKAKQLILEYAYTEGNEKGMDFDSDLWSSSHNSCTVDSDEFSVSPKNHNSNKVKFFNKLRRLIRGKDVHFHYQNQGSSADKTTGAEEFDSWGISSSVSTATDAASEMPFNRPKSASPDSCGVSFRRSMDIPTLKNPNIDGIKDSEFGRRHSDMGSTYENKRAFSARITGHFMSPENQAEQSCYASEKAELKKFAEALKDSENETRKGHRKSTSLGSFLGVRS